MNAEHFYIDGQGDAAEPYHYTECGLDNIYLANGFRKETYDGEEYVSIENVDGLWKAIGFSLLRRSNLLEPKEIRFLRRHIGMTQAELAQMLRVDAQTVARWEKGQTEIQGPADMAIRVLMLASSVMQPEGGEVLSHMAEFMQKLTSKDAEVPGRAVFSQEGNVWHPTALAA
ncbi:helix-turn-helix domain-containing protein [Xanthobacter sediminis]